MLMERKIQLHFPTNNIFHALGNELKTEAIPVKSVDLAWIYWSGKEGEI